MKKGYFVVRIDVKDADGFAEYAKLSAPAIAKFGGRYLARGGAIEAVEGIARGRNTIVEFDSFEQAKACYFSADYQAAKAKRVGVSETDFLLLEGME